MSTTATTTTTTTTTTTSTIIPGDSSPPSTSPPLPPPSSSSPPTSPTTPTTTNISELESRGFHHVRLSSQPPTPPQTLRTVSSSPTFSRVRGCLRDSVSLCLPHLDPPGWRTRAQTPPHGPPPQSTRPYDVAVRIILLGDFHVGKTSILRSLSRAKDDSGTCCCCEFRPGELVTAIFKRDRKQSLVKVMDTGGQEKYRSMTSSYYRGVHGCLLVFDVTREDTFLNIVSWCQDLEKYTGDQFVASILVGTTSHPGQRVVSAERAFKMAENLEMTYLETDTDDDPMTIAIVHRLVDTVIRNGFFKSSSSVVIVPQHDTRPLGKHAHKCSC